MIRIAITGPESSGKTTLAKMLAEKLEAYYVPEFARDYLMQRQQKSYTIEDVVYMAKMQFKNNQQDHPGKDFVVCDTELTVFKVWLDDKFNRCPTEVLNLLKAQKFDFIFLCTPDIPWEKDPLREDSGRRDFLFEKYIEELNKQDIRYFILKGDESERLNRALSILL